MSKAGTSVLLAGTALAGISGCATLVRGSSQTVTASTQPPGAVCEFKRRSGPSIFANLTPQTVTLERARMT